MSEGFTKHRRIVERLSRHIDLRFASVSWPCDGHECPSYKGLFRHRTENLTHLQQLVANCWLTSTIRTCVQTAHFVDGIAPKS